GFLIFWAAVFGATAYVTWKSRRTFSREKSAMLVAASLLLAPYAAGNSILAVLALGVIPLFFKRRWLGLSLILLADLNFLFGRDLSAYYATGVVLAMWAILTWQVWKTEISQVLVANPVTTAPQAG